MHVVKKAVKRVDVTEEDGRYEMEAVGQLWRPIKRTAKRR